MNKNKKNWWIDALLFISFMVTFLLDLTGLELHQWVGILAGLFIIVHYILHRKWIFTIVENFLGRTTWRARICFLIDFGLILGFVVIIFTGVIMSTWLDLNLGNYEAWRVLHYWASIATLQVVLLKIILHWDWIINVSRMRLFPLKQKALTPALKMESNLEASASRRQFLRIGAAVGAVAILEGVQMGKALAVISGLNEDTQTTGQENTVNTYLANDELGSGESTFGQNPTSSPSTSPEILASTPTSQAVLDTGNLQDSCVVRCPRGCSYPGHCRRYTDSNNNGLCDLGECL